ncbi:hypothetical protein CTI12_AA003410 [Artemisia annua]|uniref:Uncharacterized protein n=1 Tax=Artemisia annua TaxID=35608 RepID=A0A2U1QP48_ARTAN|nr:hypothetical protein CTI12_AA003410 [Artemisia annua]
MGCISSKSPTREQQPDNHVVIKHAPPNHHLLALVTPSKTKHTIIDDASELIAASKHDILTLPPNNNNNPTVDVIERCASFHTVEEYDELLQRIRSHTNDDSELLKVPVPDNSDSACKKDSSDDDTGNKTVNMEFQTVASLRQWLESSSNKGGGVYAANDYPNPRTGFAFYQDNTSNKNTATSLQVQNSALVETDKQHEDESIEELVAAFDKYMQQLQIDEDNFLRQINNTECAC